MKLEELLGTDGELNIPLETPRKSKRRVNDGCWWGITGALVIIVAVLVGMLAMFLIVDEDRSPESSPAPIVLNPATASPQPSPTSYTPSPSNLGGSSATPSALPTANTTVVPIVLAVGTADSRSSITVNDKAPQEWQFTAAPTTITIFANKIGTVQPVRFNLKDSSGMTVASSDENGILQDFVLPYHDTFTISPVGLVDDVLFRVTLLGWSSLQHDNILANDLGQSGSGVYDQTILGWEHWWTFEASAGDHLTADLQSQDGSPTNLRVELISPQLWDLTEPSTIVDYAALPEDGWYTLVVKGETHNDEGAYILTYFLNRWNSTFWQVIHLFHAHRFINGFQRIDAHTAW